MDPARVISLVAFKDFVESSSLKPKRIAVVSGSIREPELKFLPASAEVVFFDFEASEKWDLCADWGDGRLEGLGGLGGLGGTFDLVLCEQVLEHLLDPARAVQNLHVLLRSGGKAHVSVPGINGTHGLPTYFYAGFHPSALELFFRTAGFASSNTGGWGSTKAVMMYSTCDWTPLFFSEFPRSITKFRPRNLRDILRGLHHFFRYGRKTLFPGGSRHYVISWGVGIK
jgi:SAM-dependent methyltransferase